MLAFGWLAYTYWHDNQRNWSILYLGLAVLFQPIFKIALGREIWIVIDMIVAAFLVLPLIYKSKVKN